MSVAAKKYVERNSPARGSKRAVHAMVAWAADGQGRNALVPQRWLAERTGLSRATVQRALADLERDDLIRRHRGGRDHCAKCREAQRGVLVFDVVIAEELEEQNPGQMTLLAGAAPAPDDRPHDRPQMRPVADRHRPQGEAGSGLRVRPHYEVNDGLQQQQQPAGEESIDQAAAVDRVLDALRTTRFGEHLDRHAISVVVASYAPAQVDEALMVVVALAGDRRYVPPKGGAAVVLAHELRRLTESASTPPRSPRGDRTPSTTAPSNGSVSDRRGDALSRLAGMGASA